MAAKKPSIDTGIIRELANLLNETDLTEIVLEEGNLRLKLSREVTVTNAPIHAHVPAPAAPAPVAALAEPAKASAATALETSGTPVTSPMVGTAYLSPAPDAKPFVNVGDTVQKGQTIMIVEAMKTMNQIPSSHDGVIAAINVEDGQPVEYGETLITLK